jgi:hypothetical protein
MAQSLPAMKTNPKFIFFTDFDGTITLFDSEYHFSSATPLLCNVIQLFICQSHIPPTLGLSSLEASYHLIPHPSSYHIIYIHDVFQIQTHAYLCACDMLLTILQAMTSW